MFSSIVINKLYGSNVYALLPRDIVYRNNSQINKVIIFSYSGTTNDLLEATKDFDNSNKYIVTKGEVQKIVLKTDVSKKILFLIELIQIKERKEDFYLLKEPLVLRVSF